MKASLVFKIFLFLSILSGFACPVHAAAQSPYMGGPVNLIKAPNGAVVREEVLKTGARIIYLEPTTEKLADGVYLKAKGRTDLFQKILETAGL